LTAKTIDLEWKKKRKFFELFVEPRNAIEHIDGAANDKTKWAFFNLNGDRFSVVNGVTVDVNQDSLEKVLSTRQAIAEAIIKEYHDPMLGLLESLGVS